MSTRLRTLDDCIKSYKAYAASPGLYCHLQQHEGMRKASNAGTIKVSSDIKHRIIEAPA